jgi:hypothetical protein
MAQLYTRRYACERVISAADLPAACKCKLDALNLTADQQLDLLDAACDTLAKLSRLPVGRCAKPYRPCRDACRYFDCACACGPNGIPLPGILPKVTAVKINGVVVDTATYATVKSPGGAYTLERFLVDGTVDIWPHWQRVYLPDTADETFQITVEMGLYPDEVMRAAAAEIACDMISRLANERHVAPGTVSANAYGVTVSNVGFGDTPDKEAQNLAGLHWLRRFVSSNGGGQPTAIYSPDLDRGWSLYERV